MQFMFVFDEQQKEKKVLDTKRENHIKVINSLESEHK